MSKSANEEMILAAETLLELLEEGGLFPEYDSRSSLYDQINIYLAHITNKNIDEKRCHYVTSTFHEFYELYLCTYYKCAGSTFKSKCY